MKIIDGIAVFGEADPGALSQMKTCAKDERVRGTALMADNHRGYAVPIGGVIAYEGAISPSGVGYDIACGNKAVKLNVRADDLLGYFPGIMNRVWDEISFGMGRKNNVRVDHELFDSDTWKLPCISGLKNLAREQLGTVGSGNHYVDIFRDENGFVWAGCHFGSRGLGHKTATFFLNACGAKDGMDVPPAVIDVNTSLGADYIACMELAGRYAYAGRDWVCQTVANILGGKIVEQVHNHHNFAWFENGLWVVRKGATPAYPGQKGFVGGTMAETSVILEGNGGIWTDEYTNCKLLQSYALYSTVHGAGRVMGRMEATGKYDKKTGECKREGKIPKNALDIVRAGGVELRGAGLDEAPGCYKRLPDVLREQGASIRILHELTPLGVAMAGPDIRDPYKD